MQRILATPLALALLIAGCAQSRIGDFEFAEGIVQHAVPAGEVAWQACPPHLPPGCEVAVLEGNPQGNGMFTVRFRLTDDFLMRAHIHPKDERVTVLKGRVAVGFGVGATRADAREFGPGDYYVNARGAVHTVWADRSSEIQITGIGPWQAHFVE